MHQKPGLEKVRQEEVRSRLVLELSVSLSSEFSGSYRASPVALAMSLTSACSCPTPKTPLPAQGESRPSLWPQSLLAEG